MEKNDPSLPRRLHTLGLLWLTVGLRYVLLERFVTAGRYYEISCPLDGLIPFCEWFLIPYFLWYFLIIGVHLYTCFQDVPAFRWYTRYLAVSFSISTAVFLLFPSCQKLRPEAFPRENLLTAVTALLYRTDTCTNVFPSEHVIGSVAAYLAARRCRRLKPLGLPMGICAALCAASTVFLKQHSLLDAAGAAAVCGISSFVCKNHRNSDKFGIDC